MTDSRKATIIPSQKQWSIQYNLLRDCANNNHGASLAQEIEKYKIDINSNCIYGYNFFHLAIQNEDIHLTKALAASNVDINAIGKISLPDGKAYLTPLQIACYSNNPAIIEVILKAKAKVNVLMDTNDSELHYLFDGDIGINTFKCLELLFEKDVQANQKNIRGLTPLATLFNNPNIGFLNIDDIINIFKLFHAKGMGLEQLITNDHTCIQLLMSLDKPLYPILEQLVKNNLLDFKAATNKKTNPFIQAIELGNNKAAELFVNHFGPEIAKLTIENETIEAQLETKIPKTHYLLVNESGELIDKLIDRDHADTTKEQTILSDVNSLVIAANLGNVELTELCLTAGVLPSQIDSNGNNLFHSLFYSNPKNCLDIIDIILKKRSNDLELFTSLNHEKRFPLLHIIAAGNYNLLENLIALIKQRYDSKTVTELLGFYDDPNETLLLHAVVRNADLDVINLLLKNDADASIQIEHRKMILAEALARSNLAVFYRLLSHFAQKDGSNELIKNFSELKVTIQEKLIHSYKHDKYYQKYLQCLKGVTFDPSDKLRVVKIEKCASSLNEIDEKKITQVTMEDTIITTGYKFLENNFGTAIAKTLTVKEVNTGKETLDETSQSSLGGNNNTLFSISPQLTFFDGKIKLTNDQLAIGQLNKTPNCYYFCIAPSIRHKNNTYDLTEFTNYRTPVNESALINDKGLKNIDDGAKVFFSLIDNEVYQNMFPITKEFKLPGAKLDRVLVIEIPSDNKLFNNHSFQGTLHLGVIFKKSGLHDKSTQRANRNKCYSIQMTTDELIQSIKKAELELQKHNLLVKKHKGKNKKH